MISDKTLDCLREHYHLDELYAEPDYDREHLSPCKKHIAYDYKVFVRKGDISFEFYTAVHWTADITQVAWYEFWTRVFVGSEVTHYSVDEVSDAEYLKNMVMSGLEQGKENEQGNEI